MVTKTGATKARAITVGATTSTSAWHARVGALDWHEIGATLTAQGAAATGPLLTPAECAMIRDGYDDDARFRSRIVMAQHGFGRGEYKYFAYPLPDLVQGLRSALYPRLATIANDWTRILAAKGGAPKSVAAQDGESDGGESDGSAHFPLDHAAFLDRCHAAGQTRPTPLLLRYGEGDYNCLHQDLYGAHVFPLQVAILLSAPATRTHAHQPDIARQTDGGDFEGGEFVVVEQRPRMQSRAEVIALGQGEAVVFAVHHRPVQGTKGPYRVTLRHGVSRIRRGARFTLGIIFHDAQ